MERLKRLRAEKGLSQARLAARAELDPSTVNQIERGAREASPATLRKLADALEISLYELLEEESPKAQGRPSSPELIGGEGRRALYLTTTLEEVRSLASLAERELGTMVRTFFDKIPDLPPTETVKLATGWNWRIGNHVGYVFSEAKRWETRVLKPLSGEDLPQWERELLGEIHAELDKAEMGVNKLRLEFNRRWDEAYEEARRAPNQETLTVEQLLESVRVDD